MKEKIQQRIIDYIAAGFTNRHDFPGEYVLLINPKTFDAVRVYEDGQIWATEPRTGAYVKVKA